ncbi:MurR/RpiR family transcriptional regulator [Merdibacter massiliensis]|uniref:MurR/RpiR family transcriptional regulator n=1 Tax=Merdibacter massiliensis TaxID=1871030 RepID=UPI00096ABB12|nr:MurR/RpiR family transcriptional regulator [Merdibacter massiliensis]
MKIPIPLQIKSIYSELSPTEKRIANYILENPKKIATYSISDLSSDLGIADSTFFQFTKKLGFKGFKDFKMTALIERNDIDLSVPENIMDSDDELAMAQKVFDSNIKTLKQTSSVLQRDDLAKAARYISDANNIYFFGVGGSEIIAQDAYHKFLRSPTRPHHDSDYHIQVMESSLLTPKDVAICISHTGKSKETIHLAEISKNNGAKVIVITSHKTSPLAKLGDIVLISISEEIEFRSEALSSRISQLAILDSLYVILCFMHKKQAQQRLKKIRASISTIKTK